MTVVSACDMPGTEYARSMAKLAKTLQQTISGDVRIAVLSVDYEYILLLSAGSVVSHRNYAGAYSIETVCLLVRCFGSSFSKVVYLSSVKILLLCVV